MHKNYVLAEQTECVCSEKRLTASRYTKLYFTPYFKEVRLNFRRIVEIKSFSLDQTQSRLANVRME